MNSEFLSSTPAYHYEISTIISSESNSSLVQRIKSMKHFSSRLGKRTNAGTSLTCMFQGSLLGTLQGGPLHFQRS